MQIHYHFVEGEIYVREADLEEFQKIISNTKGAMDMPPGQTFKLGSGKEPTRYTINDYTRSAQEIV